ncbi:MAG: hypothetical protein WCD79_10185 [Chthoniobacteraceae bacterium]
MLKHLILLFVTTTAFAELPPLEDARVSIPYPELKALWQAAQPVKTEEVPPVAARLLAARYHLSYQPGQVEGIGEFEVQCFTKEWTFVPLFGEPAQIDSVEPPDASVFVREGQYVLVVNQPGLTKVKVHFAAKLEANADSESLRLAVNPAAINTVTLDGVPDGKVAQVEGGTVIAGDKTKASFRLPAKNILALVLQKPAPAPPAPLPITPSQWRVDSQALVTFADGKAVYDVQMTVNTETGSGLSMELQLAPGTRVIEVKGDDLVRWQPGNPLRITWQTRDILSRTVHLRYEVPHAIAPGEWTLRIPQVTDGKNEDTIFAVAADSDLDLRVAKPVETQLPHWLRDATAGQKVVVVGKDGAVTANWQPLVKTSPAVIESEQASMRVVADGALLNEVAYKIRHEGLLAWKVELPADSQLLTCTVKGHAVNPIDRGAGIIEIDLNGEQSEVQFSYTGRKPKFQPVSGKLEVELPKTDLLISRIDWELRIPANYELTAMEGNVEDAPGGSQGVIKLCKELCKDDQPTAQLFYQKVEAR